MKRAVGNPLALAVLAALLLRPMHPYEMARQFVEYGKDRDIKFTRSSLYMVVGQLAKAGFVTEQETLRDTARPERTVYSITSTGRAELNDWMREIVAEPAVEYPQFGVALSLLTVLPPDEVRELLATRLATLDATIAEIDSTVAGARAGGLDWWHLVEEEYRIARTRAERDYVAQLSTALAGDDYRQAWQETFGGQQ
ncbi:PadR family transcriptional regulator [Pseudonocardia sp. TRM90224]|uniref:PadR family transcriptional regulator n=1 Tax=Pseudonocardia sp. TRM90224 TaxID=2812678 RepID=UPI001E491999|nr:PadR family transcriptional regulator [Pseudonocardia sp. TRM90224]